MANKAIGSIIIELINAEELMGVDGGSADPFLGIVANGCCFQLATQWNGSPMERNGYGYPYCTGVQYKTLNPNWNVTFEIPITVATGGIQFQVFDYENLGSNKAIGVADVAIASMASGSAKPMVLQLINVKKNAPAGRINIKVSYNKAEALMADMNPLEELSTWPRPSYQFKLFQSVASANPLNDVKMANTMAREYINAVQAKVRVVSIENQYIAGGGMVVVWFEVR